jgi:putative copper resistance protein D
VDELIVGARAIHFAAVALLFGAPMFRLCVEPRASNAVAPVPAIALAAAAVGLLSAVGWFIGVTAEMADGWSEAFTADTLGAVGFDTRFGRLWIARFALMVVVIALCALGRWSRGKDIALLVLSAVATASLVAVGHGTEGRGMLGPVHALADMLHLLCASIWIGGLFCLALVLRCAFAGTGDALVLSPLLQRFSHVGYGAVTLLVLSGCINALALLPSVDALIRTTYGRLLLLKIGLAGSMIALAIINRIVLAPRLIMAPGARGALWWSVIVEQGLGLFILATVARLGTIHPTP